MKKFSQFIQEANKSLSEFADNSKNRATFNAKRFGWVNNGHGDWYKRIPGTKEYEYVGDSETDTTGVTRIRYSNKNQRINKKDPPENRNISAPSIPPSHQTAEEYEKELREKYVKGEIFKEGEWVENLNNGLVGKIIRRGTNYLICVTEDNIMFKPWIKDVVEWTDKSGVPADQREVGTDEFRKYVMSLTDTKKIKNFNITKFINKYKVNRT